MIALMVTVLAAWSLAACGELGDDRAPDYRYRLTVEVDTPEGLRTGSSVIEVEQRFVRSTADLSALKIDRSIRGEAVAVDLPNGRTMFALLRSESDIEWAEWVVAALVPSEDAMLTERLDADIGEYDGDIIVEPEEGGGSSMEGAFSRVLLLEGQVDLPQTWPANRSRPERSAYPMLVAFEDEADPTNVARVDPDDLAASFGEGVSLRRIAVELTDDPVTTGIEERLGWLSRYPEPRLDPEYRGSTNPNLSQRLWHGDFRKGSPNGP